ncbi:MAG: radical SAM protein [Nitrospinae bacterium]|nr:radical SAM protein [Nitrospinota bacterium]
MSKYYFPKYLQLKQSGELDERAEEFNQLLTHCTLCPFECGINRIEGEFGACNAGFEPRIKSAHANFGEIPELSGKYGCGYISFKNELSGDEYVNESEETREFEIEELAKQMVSLQIRSCHNISFVTPTNYAAQVIEALSLAIEGGFILPIVWNCSGFESIRVLKLLDGIVDVYIVDFSLIRKNLSLKDNSKSAAICEAICGAVREMFKQITSIIINKEKILNHGIVIRSYDEMNSFCNDTGLLTELAKEIEVKHKEGKLIIDNRKEIKNKRL